MVSRRRTPGDECVPYMPSAENAFQQIIANMNVHYHRATKHVRADVTNDEGDDVTHTMRQIS